MSWIGGTACAADRVAARSSAIPETEGGYAMIVGKAASRFGLSLAMTLLALALGSGGAAWAQSYPPNGTDFPTITLNEGREGVAGLKPFRVPPPQASDRESIWNTKVVGVNDRQGRPSSDDRWIEEQDRRHIVFMNS